jgi:hypothetical protein
MATETFPSGAMKQPESDGDVVPEVEGVDRDRFVNYSEQEQYLYRDANAVALEVFGDEFVHRGLFFSEAGRDHDVPYLVVWEGDGLVTSYNLFSGGDAAARGLGGIVITEAEAEYLRTA